MHVFEENLSNLEILVYNTKYEYIAIVFVRVRVWVLSTYAGLVEKPFKGIGVDLSEDELVAGSGKVLLD